MSSLDITKMRIFSIFQEKKPFENQTKFGRVRVKNANVLITFISKVTLKVISLLLPLNLDLPGSLCSLDSVRIKNTFTLSYIKYVFLGKKPGKGRNLTVDLSSSDRRL